MKRSRRWVLLPSILLAIARRVANSKPERTLRVVEGLTRVVGRLGSS